MPETIIAVLEDVVKREIVDANTGSKREYYCGVMRSDIAKGITFVPVETNSKKTYLNEDSASGYQRPASLARMNMFLEYLKGNPLSIVPPVVISGRGKWIFEPTINPTFGILNVMDKAAIIDGQHRVGGYVGLQTKNTSDIRPVEFILIPDLSRDDEVVEFLTINTTQKGVGASLAVSLEGELGKNDNAIVAWQLNMRDDSPFKGKIAKHHLERTNLFTLSAVTTNVGRALSSGAFQDTTLDSKVDIMIGYWTKISDSFPVEWDDINKLRSEMEYKLLETTGLIAWSHSGTDILGPCFDSLTQSMNWGCVEVKIKKLAEMHAVEWGKHAEFEGLTGEVGGRAIHKKIQKCLSIGEENDGERPE